MINKKLTSIFLLLPILLILSCGTDVYSSEEQKNTSDTTSEVTIASELFSADEEDENLFVFETNDISYLNSKGCTLWTLKKENTENETFTSRTVRLVKESGSANAGFGIVFCVQESDTVGAYDMFTVLLNTNGQYAVGKIIKGNYTNIQWWTDSQFINRGYGSVNYVHIEYNTVSEEFTLFINNAEVLKFSDLNTLPRLYYGGNGYVAVIANNENYPTVSTKITFLEINGTGE